MFTPPTLLPQVSSNFNPNQVFGKTNNGVKPNGGTAGAMAFPTGNSGGNTGSFVIYGEALVNPNLSYANQGQENLLLGLSLLTNSSPGQPAFVFQRLFNGGFPSSNWWQIPNVAGFFQLAATAGSNYASGLYPFTASGGGCTREPGGVWQGAGLNIVDPGFGCSTAPTFSAATVPNAGAQQTGITATCAASGVSGPDARHHERPGVAGRFAWPAIFAEWIYRPPAALPINTTFFATSVTGSGSLHGRWDRNGNSCPTSGLPEHRNLRERHKRRVHLPDNLRDQSALDWRDWNHRQERPAHLLHARRIRRRFGAPRCAILVGC